MMYIIYFPEPYTHSKNKIKVELDLCKYTPKSDLKIAACADTSKYAKKIDLAILKSDIDELDIVQLQTTPADLTK